MASPSPLPEESHLLSTCRRRVSYFYDPEVGAFAYPFQHPMKPHRMRMAHALIGAYGMLKQMQVVRPRRADELDLTRYHTDEYIHFLQTITAENYNEWTANKKFCQTDDCPAWDGLYDFATLTAGSSISAAHSLVTGHSDIALNWAGGLHHAKRAEASGFCYVNDIVLGILELLRVHARVLYIDIDIHHGDGVEEAFYTTDRVMTCSFHKYGDFFPGTGTVQDDGKGKGKGYAVNFPLRDGLSDEKFINAFKSVVGAIMQWYRPGAVVLQGGADSLAGDKLGVFNLSMNAHAAAAAYVRTFDVPLLMLGGGGYTVKNVARTWTYETAVAIGCQNDIPEDLPNNEYLEWFGPRYKLEVLRNNMMDHNSDEYLENVKQTIFRNLKDLPHAPSAQMRKVSDEPKTWAGDDWLEEDSDMDDVDKRISRRFRDSHTNGAVDPLTDSEDESVDDPDDGPLAYKRTLRERKVPRKHRYSERFTPSPSLSDEDAEEEEEPAHHIYAPRKRPRVFFHSPAGAFVDPRLAEWNLEEAERERVEAILRAERERQREALRAALEEAMDDEEMQLDVADKPAETKNAENLDEDEEDPDLGEQLYPLTSARDKTRSRSKSKTRSLLAAGDDDEDGDADGDMEKGSDEDEDDQDDQDQKEEQEDDDEQEDQDEEEEQDEDDEDDDHDRLKPMLHPTVLARLSHDREAREVDEDGNEQEDDAEDQDQDDDNDDDADVDVDVDVDVEVDEDAEEDADVDATVHPVPIPSADAEDDESDLSGDLDDGDADGDGDDAEPTEQDRDVEEGELEEDREGSVELGAEVEVEAEVGDLDRDLGEEEEEPEPDDAEEGADDADADLHADVSHLATPTPEVEPHQLPTPPSSEPSTVSLSRSPTGSPHPRTATGGGDEGGNAGAEPELEPQAPSRDEMEEGELEEGEEAEEDTDRNLGTKDPRSNSLRLDLGDAPPAPSPKAATAQPDLVEPASSPVHGFSSATSPPHPINPTTLSS